MTILEAKQLKIGDRVIVKRTNRTIEIARIKERGTWIGGKKYIEIESTQGGCWTHKELIKIDNM